MAKAALVGTATSLYSSGKDWFTNPTSGAGVASRPDRTTGQGFGRLHLDTLFQNIGIQVFSDNLTMLPTGTVRGNTFTKVYSSYRTIVVLAWNDPVTLAHTTAAALQSDLDLEVVIGGTSYRGNGLSGDVSIAGSSYDRVNNVEIVVLPYDPGNVNFTVNVRKFRVNLSTDYALYVMNAY